MDIPIIESAKGAETLAVLLVAVVSGDDENARRSAVRSVQE